MSWLGIRRVVDRRVVAAQDQLDALQPHHPVRLRPPPVVADHHADEAAERPPHAEALRPGLEVVALGVLERPVRLVLLVPRQVDLAVAGDDRAVALDEDLGVVAVAHAVGIGLGQLGVAEAEADAEAARLVEQRLRLGPRHRGLVEVVELGDVGDEPAGEERRQRQLGEHDEVAAPVGRLGQQREHPLDDVLAGVGSLDRTELGRTDGQQASGHGDHRWHGPVPESGLRIGGPSGTVRRRVLEVDGLVRRYGPVRPPSTG